MSRASRPGAGAAFLALLVAPGLARGEGAPAADTEVRPTIPWVLTQLLPSPEVVVGRSAGDGSPAVARFGLRWQVTPILYSFGVDPRVSPWRALVVEPIVRQSGSVELFVSPEVFTGSLFDTPLVRAGVRSYFPLVAKGEELSFSLATSYSYMNGNGGVGYEVGVYTLYGVVGLQLTYAPAPSSPVQWITTLRIRYF